MGGVGVKYTDYKKIKLWDAECCHRHGGGCHAVVKMKPTDIRQATKQAELFGL